MFFDQCLPPLENTCRFCRNELDLQLQLPSVCKCPFSWGAFKRNVQFLNVTPTEQAGEWGDKVSESRGGMDGWLGSGRTGERLAGGWMSERGAGCVSWVAGAWGSGAWGRASFSQYKYDF